MACANRGKGERSCAKYCDVDPVSVDLTFCAKTAEHVNKLLISGTLFQVVHVIEEGREELQEYSLYLLNSIILALKFNVQVWR